MSNSLRPHEPQHAQASLSITNSRSPPKPMSVESVMPSNHLILCHPVFLSPSIFPSIRLFSNESVLLIRWPKYWSFSYTISPSNKYLRLIPFRMDWLDLIAVQGTLKYLIQCQSSKASILQHSASFIFQLSHPRRTTGKTIALTRWTVVCKVMSLLKTNSHNSKTYLSFPVLSFWEAPWDMFILIAAQPAYFTLGVFLVVFGWKVLIESCVYAYFGGHLQLIKGFCTLFRSREARITGQILRQIWRNLKIWQTS